MTSRGVVPHCDLPGCVLPVTCQCCVCEGYSCGKHEYLHSGFVRSLSDGASLTATHTAMDTGILVGVPESAGARDVRPGGGQRDSVRQRRR